MNQILVSEKIYVTPEMKLKKILYKLFFFFSCFICFFLSSCYICSQYARTKNENISKEILAHIELPNDDTVMNPDSNVMVVVFEPRYSSIDVINVPKKLPAEATTYVASNGITYYTDSILEIPKINLKYPVLSNTSQELLSVSLTKFWGQYGPNEIGNYCIAGHYYTSNKMFGYLHKLQNGDIAKLTDLSGRTIEYAVYDKYIVEPTDTSCTSQVSARNMKVRELTLITCTNHGKQRLIVKLREV